MSKPARAHIKCDNGVHSPMTRWEPSQHERTTPLDHPMELQTDRTEIAPGGPSEVAEPLCAAHLRCAVHHAPLQEIAETVSRALAYLTDRLIWPYCLPLKKAEQLIKRPAQGRTGTPQTRKTPAPTEPASGRIAVKKGHQTSSKKPRRRTF